MAIVSTRKFLTVSFRCPGGRKHSGNRNILLNKKNCSLNLSLKFCVLYIQIKALFISIDSFLENFLFLETFTGTMELKKALPVWESVALQSYHENANSFIPILTEDSRWGIFQDFGPQFSHNIIPGGR